MDHWVAERVWQERVIHMLWDARIRRARVRKLERVA